MLASCTAPSIEGATGGSEATTVLNNEDRQREIANVPAGAVIASRRASKCDTVVRLVPALPVGCGALRGYAIRVTCGAERRESAAMWAAAFWEGTPEGSKEAPTRAAARCSA